MRRLFIQFYLLLITCFTLCVLLVGLVYRGVADKTGTPLLADLLRTTLALIEFELRNVPQPQWPQTLATLDHDLGFALTLNKEEKLGLDNEAIQALRHGEIVLLEDNATYLQRLEGTPYVLVAGPMPYLLFLQALRWFDFALLAAVGISLAVPVFLWMRPHWQELQKLEHGARELAEGNIDVRVQLPEKSGLQPLAQSFNHMADSIEQLLDSKQSLLNAVAHELRTPLARLRYRLALRDEYNSAETDAGVERDLGDIGALIDELLLHARLARPHLTIHQDRLPAQSWLTNRLQDSPAAIKQIPCSLRVQQGQLTADPALMARALDNLLNNASRYARQQLLIEFSQQDGWQCLTVSDDGPGIAPEQRQRVLEPFIRLDAEAPHSKGHHGLGLAIVSQIMHAHGGRIEIGESQWCGTKVSLHWPLVQSVTEENICQQTA